MLTLAEPLSYAARHWAARTAVICGDDSYTFSQLHERCARLVGALSGLGARQGDRIAVLSLNSHRFVEAFLGLPAAGLVVVPLNTRLAWAELGPILADARATVLLTDRAVPTEIADLVDTVVQMPDAYEALLAAASPGDISGHGVNEDALAAMFFTGGTTGRSKGVMLSHRNLIANAYHKTLGVRIDTHDVFLAAPALFHVAGTAALHGLCWRGAATVVQPSFDPAGALDLIEQHRVTFALPVPTMVAAMVDEQLARPRDVSSLRLLGHAGSPIASEVLRRAKRAFPTAQLAHFYGATETCSIACHLMHEELQLGDDAAGDGPLLGSCGVPALGVRIRVVGPDAIPVGVGEVGEVCVAGNSVMMGYWENPTATAEAVRDGWYHTGDLGRLDADGNLFIVDRLKDMIVSGGENVYSVEVEEVLARHPGVIEVAVIGVPDERWGEAVVAVVVPAPESDPATLGDELRAFCRQFLAGYKVPKRIDVRHEPLPKSGPGKVLKRALRDEVSPQP